MSDCLFCKIVNQELPCEAIWQDEQILVFKDIYPRAPLHYLIIPKNHIESIATAGAEEIARDLIKKAKDMAVAEKVSGYKLVFNVGPGAGQTVPHLHLHFLSGGDAELNI